MKNFTCALACAAIVACSGSAMAYEYEYYPNTHNIQLNPGAISLFTLNLSSDYSVADSIDVGYFEIELSDYLCANYSSFDGTDGQDNVFTLYINGDAIVTDVSLYDLAVDPNYTNGYDYLNGYYLGINNDLSGTKWGVYDFWFDITSYLENSTTLTVSIALAAGSGSMNLISTGVYFDTTPVPEPSAMLLFGAGLVGLTALNRRREKK